MKALSGTSKRVLFSLTAAGGLLALFQNCAPTSSSEVNTTSAASNASSVSGKISLSVSNSAGSMIYSDAALSTSSSLDMVAGQSYTINLGQSNAISGTTYSLQATQTNVVSGTVNSFPLKLGSNTITVPAMGDYSWKIVATPLSGAAVTSYYIASVSCASPTFTSASLLPAAMSVSAVSTNLFSLSASGVVASANGQGPYTCAWDPTGTGIQDTVFQSCSTPVSSFYSNFLGSRKVGLIVKDSCNTTYTVSSPQTFTSTEPTMPGNVFVTAQLTNAAGLVQNDPRVSNVNYLGTNTTGHNIVIPNYNSGAFQIYSLMNYGLPSSVQFGVEIKLTGIVDTLSVSAQTGTVNVANATIASVNYSTDQAGDSSAAASLSSNSCVLTNQGSRVVMTAGAPCTAGLTGDNNKITVEVYGHYSCAAINESGGSATIAGDFDGYSNLVDSCTGGGGGGGGIVPIKL